MSIGRVLRRLRARFARPRFRRVERQGKRSRLPTSLRRDTIYVVGAPEQWLVFLCPCGDHHDVALSIGMSGRWLLTTNSRHRPSIYPSVDAIGPSRRCHYWVTDGRVRWCAGS